jgi:ribokinase
MTNFDVVGFGALNLDKLFKVDRIAQAEEESFVESLHEVCGGSAANTVVGLARLGCKVGFLGKVGPDSDGEKQLAEFRKENVDTSGIIHSEEGKSGSVMGFVDHEGARALYINSGVNDLIGFADIDLNYASKTRFLHLTSFVGEKSFESQKKLVENLSGKVQISFDPGALYAKRGLAQLAPLVDATHVLMPNRGELELLTGHSDYVQGADALIARGVKIIGVKLGAEGCYVTDGQERHRIEAFRVEVRDTTGAGDAFCAGFLYGLLKKMSLKDCGKVGNFVASKCVMQMGARAGLPWVEDLEFLG